MIETLLPSRLVCEEGQSGPAFKMSREQNSDIFASLLAQSPTERCTQDPLGNSLADGMSYCTTVTHLQSGVPLAVTLHHQLLIVLKNSADEQGSTVVVWRVRSVSGNSRWPFTIQQPPIMKISCSEAIPSLLTPTPYLVVHSSYQQSVPSTGSCQLATSFFAAVFGPGALLGDQSALFYTSPQSGTLHACDLKNPTGSLTGLCGNIQSQSVQVVYSLEQPAIGIHPFPSHHGSSSDSLLVVGTRGKILLCSPSPEPTQGLTFREFFVNGPILSSLFIHSCGLLLSTVNGVLLVCLNPHCLSASSFEDGTRDTSLSLVEAFHSPLTILNTPLHLLSSSHCDASHHSFVLGLSPHGLLVRMEFSTSLDSYTTGTLSAGRVGLELTRTFHAIEESSLEVAEVQQEIAVVSDHIAELGEAIALLCAATGGHSVSGLADPFQCEVCGSCEQITLSNFRPTAVVHLTYTGAKPLSSHWSLVVQSSPCHTSTLSPSSDPPVAISSSLSLNQLSTSSSVTLNQPLSCSLLSRGPLSIRCLLQYSFALPVAGRMSQSAQGVVIPLKTVTLTALDFLHPESRHTSITVGGSHVAPVNPDPTTPSGCLLAATLTVSSMATKLLSSSQSPSTSTFESATLLASLLSHPSQNPPHSLVSLIKTTSSSGQHGPSSELSAVCYDGSHVLFRAELLHSHDSGGEQGALHAQLSIQTTSEQLMLQLCESIHNKLQVCLYYTKYTDFNVILPIPEITSLWA